MTSVDHRPPQRMCDVSTDQDLMLMADAVYQECGGLLDAEIRCERPVADVAAEALAHLAVSAALVERLRADRYDWVLLALTHGATAQDVATATGCAVVDVIALLGGAPHG